MTVAELPTLWNMMIWGFVATVAMTIVMQGAQGLGLVPLELAISARHVLHRRPTPSGERRFCQLRDRRLVVRLSLFSPFV
jgi:hypothetical protein